MKCMNTKHYTMPLVALHNASCHLHFITPVLKFLPCYFPGATFKCLPGLLGLLGELLGITTYSLVYRNSSDWSKRLLSIDDIY